MEKIPITFIISYPRSGSTLLGNILGSKKDIVHVGEISRLWRTNHQSLLPNRKCGCGQWVENCELWSQILSSTFSEFTNNSQRNYTNYEIAGIRDKIIRNKLVANSQINDFEQFTLTLYQNIKNYFGANKIVDSSKDFYYAQFLERLDIFDISYIHLVRELPGVVLSRQKKLKQANSSGIYKLDYKYLFADTYRWIKNYFQIKRFLKDKKSYFLRYSDFVENPLMEINKISKDSYSDVFVNENTYKLNNFHTVMGNRNRYLKGDIKIQKDNRWKTELSKFDKSLLSLLNGLI